MTKPSKIGLSPDARVEGARQTVTGLSLEAPTSAVSEEEDQADRPRAAGDALRMITKYVGLICREGGFSDPGLAAHASRTLFDLMGLATGSDSEGGIVVGPATAMLADVPSGRIRAARLEAVLAAIAEGFAEPSFTIAVVAEKLALSERYVQDLLHATGSGFAERVLELRLQRSVRLLSGSEAARHKVSDVAFACGFNDLSYFHRCFRRRFGTTPAGARTQ